MTSGAYICWILRIRCNLRLQPLLLLSNSASTALSRQFSLQSGVHIAGQIVINSGHWAVDIKVRTELCSFFCRNGRGAYPLLRSKAPLTQRGGQAGCHSTSSQWGVPSRDAQASLLEALQSNRDALSPVLAQGEDAGMALQEHGPERALHHLILHPCIFSNFSRAMQRVDGAGDMVRRGAGDD